MTIKICYCKPGIMSQCVADEFGDQYACYYFEMASGRTKCMFKNKGMNNHCWSSEAQAFGREHGVVSAAVEEEPELDFDDLKEIPRQTCMNCLLYTCDYLVQAAAGKFNGTLTDQDLWTYGSTCKNYQGEELS